MTPVPLDEADPIYPHIPDQGQNPCPTHEAATKEVEQSPLWHLSPDHAPSFHLDHPPHFLLNKQSHISD
jgi:hypothetical protein